MPRPGPRPYECVRRAWHSDRHQPMKGLIIQQIFRLVHDNHSAATKKNREWREKLPVVVLKAEEIMYSKANSEAEYSNFETLWDRVNDAVDTIIRKDESTETGKLLPPCVEAALNLGCVPVRASRSQRHTHPRTYLRPSYQECNDIPRKFLSENVNDSNFVLIPARAPHSSMPKMPGNVDSPCLFRERNERITPNANLHIASRYEKIEVDRNTSLNRGSVYPLYYGTSFGPVVSHLGFQEPKKSDSVIIGVPVFSSVSEYTEGGCLKNLFPYHENKRVRKETGEAAVRDNKGKGTEMGFDLSLRLGLSSEILSRGNDSVCATENVRHQVSHDEGMHKQKEFSFFPVESAYDNTRLHRSEWNSESGSKNSELVSRKRKLPFTRDVENDRFVWSQDSTSNHFAGQMRRPGM